MYSDFYEIYNIMIKIMLWFYAIILIPPYIMYSLGLFKLSKNQGVKRAGLAWVPYVNYYLLGILAKDSPYVGRKVKKAEIIGLIVGGIYLIYLIYTFWYSFRNISIFSQGNIETIIGSSQYLTSVIISFIMMFIGIGMRTYVIFLHYHIYKVYCPNEAGLYTALTVFSFSFITLFVIRNYKKTVTDTELTAEG